MTSDTGEIKPLFVHVYIQIFAGVLQRAVQVTVFRTIGTGAEEMAGSAVAATGHADALRDFPEIDCFDELARVFGKFNALVDGMTGVPGQLSVCPRLVMAHQAVNIFLDAKIEAAVFPAVASMAGHAIFFV